MPGGAGRALGAALAAASIGGAWPGAAAEPSPGFVAPIDEAGRLSPRWQVIGLPQQQSALTRYSATSVEGRAALQIDAQASYGNFVLDLQPQTAPRRIAWSWRIETLNPAADLRRKEGDDSAARVCLAFDLPLERVPFVERQMLRLARAKTGQHLPAATLCWVWGGPESLDQPLPNPYSARVRYLVLRGSGEPPARWADESRDVAADWRRTFGTESAELPPVVAVIVAGDADNTGRASRAQVSRLTLSP